MKPTVTILLEEYDRLRNEVSNLSKTIQSLKDDYQKHVRHKQKWYEDKKEEYKRFLTDYYSENIKSQDFKINDLEKTINGQREIIISYEKDSLKLSKKARLYLNLFILSLALWAGAVSALIFIK